MTGKVSEIKGRSGMGPRPKQAGRDNLKVTKQKKTTLLLILTIASPMARQMNKKDKSGPSYPEREKPAFKSKYSLKVQTKKRAEMDRGGAKGNIKTGSRS